MMSWHTHTQINTHIPAPQVCVHIPPVLRVFPPCSYTCDPPIPRGEECEDEGLEEGSGVRVVSSYKHLAQLCRGKKDSSLLCTGPFVLNNQWVLWSLYDPGSVFAGLIHWSSVPEVCGSVHTSYTCVDWLSKSHTRMSTAGIRYLSFTWKVFHKREDD